MKKTKRAKRENRRGPPRPRVHAALARARKRQRQRGIALIMVLGAITILTVFLTELQTDTTSTVAGALAERDRLKAEYYAKSAVNLSRMLLAAEKPIRTKIGPIVKLALQSTQLPQIPVWEFSDKILGAFNGGDRATVFGSTIQADPTTGKNLGIPGNGYFDVTIVDEDSKINVNGAAGTAPALLLAQLATQLGQPQYLPLFEAPDADGQQSDANVLCSSLVDWADPDEILTNCAQPGQGSGSEDNIYQVLGLGYVRKNAPYDSLEELRLVRGMDDDRWATFIDPDPANPRERLMTVWGQTSVNVNTAPPLVLWATVCSMATLDAPLCADPLQAAAFLQVFSLVRTFARGVPIFASRSAFTRAVEGKDVLGSFLTSMGITPFAKANWDKVRGSVRMRRAAFKAESKVFSIYADGVVPGTQREARVRIHAVVDMRQANQWNQQSTTDPNSPTGSLNPAGGPSGSPESEVEDPNAVVEQDFVNEWVQNPFGSVVYYRVD